MEVRRFRQFENGRDSVTRRIVFLRELDQLASGGGIVQIPQRVLKGSLVVRIEIDHAGPRRKLNACLTAPAF